ncbi:hypothetical protein PsorP6_006553 [Peronosclerospora sorghi]|uniref:Uncharacterized protein n=1 Tax=Peronosclerospora sorghi TaxID=230839 RepID=A0ACC0W407_9STRA|nr:hypothetical protein PsorP6_006553 [Peronosclerospora sorghi]
MYYDDELSGTGKVLSAGDGGVIASGKTLNLSVLTEPSEFTTDSNMVTLLLLLVASERTAARVIGIDALS